jgi:WD40 repeat protein
VLRSYPRTNAYRLAPDARTFVRVEGPEISTERIFVGDLLTGKERLRLASPAVDDTTEGGVALSPDGKKLALVERRKEILVRDSTTGALLATFPLPDTEWYTIGGQVYWRYHLSFSADARTLLLASGSGAIHRWDLATRRELPRLKKHLGEATAAHAPADGRTVISTGDDGVIRIWDAATGHQTQEPESYVGRTHAAFSPSGKLAAVGDAQGRIDLWNVPEGTLARRLTQGGPAATKLAFTPDGRSLAVACADRRVRFWDVATGKEGKPLVAADQNLGWTGALAFSPDGRLLCVCDYRYQLRLYELATGKTRWSGRSITACFSPDGKTVAASTGSITGREEAALDLAFFDTETGKLRKEVSFQAAGEVGSPSKVLTAACYAPDGRTLALAPLGGSVCLCDTRTGRVRKRFQAVPIPRPADNDPLSREAAHRIRYSILVRELAFSPDGRRLASSGDDGAVRIWDASTGKKVLELQGHERVTNRLAFSPDGKTILSSGDDGQVYLWSLREGGPRETEGRSRPSP